MFYGIEMDYGEPMKYFASLQLVFEALQQEGHVFVYGPDSEKYQAAAKNDGIDIRKYACYIETSTYEDGTFCENLSLWVEHYMEHMFGDPTLRPFFEAYSEKYETGEEDEI